MFWTKIGSSTGVAESGTVEEIDLFVAAGKPALLYFSSRPINPDKIDLKQIKKLRRFKAATYNKAFIGHFSGVDELRQTILRDLLHQVRELKPNEASRRLGKLDEVFQITELIRIQRKHKITIEDCLRYRDLLGLRPRSPVRTLKTSEEVGPNGFRVGYTDGRGQGGVDSGRRASGRSGHWCFGATTTRSSRLKRSSGRRFGGTGIKTGSAGSRPEKRALLTHNGPF